jgi:isoquinoline 1-oxidoreductase subunit beta
VGAPSDFGAFGPFLRIAADGTVTVISKHLEMGQGNHAGIAAIAAEELDADWTKVRVEQAVANAKAYGNPMMGGTQGTGGSSAIFSSWEPVRRAGAAARAMFVQAAADTWDVPASEVAVANGVVSHASGKRAHFGELLEAASKVKPPASPRLKDPKSFTLVGTARVRRKDAEAKSNGTARFTQDVRLPNMLTAMVAHPPRFGAKVASFEAAAARKVAGVVEVYQIPSGVAVVAT